MSEGEIREYLDVLSTTSYTGTKQASPCTMSPPPLGHAIITWYYISRQYLFFFRNVQLEYDGTRRAMEE